MKLTPCFVYILGTTETNNFRTYVGWSTNLDARLAKHNAGNGAKFTRGREWRLLYAEKFPKRGDAMSREWHLKRDRKFRKKLSQSWLSS